LLLLFLSNCATTYSCKTETAGKCQSISEVYDNLNKKSVLEVKNENTPNDQQINFKQPLEGSPILKEPKVLRVLLNYWEDEEKDLNLGGYVFVKVREAEWVIK
jgi:hypothetical protein